ncbi:MAG TPA: GNAT family N-acetyltransferase [Xanthobacteraceae bacterium]|jgi:GNAT superfamily N-acetyltransferase|nr:GNAT family N-acetyltransferase [Xanthobacteraceae bacterium]
MRIRQASPDDMSAIVDLSRELAAHVEDPDPGSDMSLLLNYGFGTDRWFDCLVAEDDGRVVGFALFCRRFEAHTREKRLWLGDLCVAGDRRGRGIGRALVTAVQTHAAELGCAAVDLEIARGNHTARVFYERLGAVISDAIELWRLPVRAAQRETRAPFA